MTTTPTITDYLKYANLQMAAEAFIRDPENPDKLRATGQDLIDALKAGNRHASLFTETQATDFSNHWIALDQRINSQTGFSGTLFKCVQDDPATGAKAGELVISFRSTEFIDDAVRDNLATNTMEIKDTGWAWGQLADMEDWYGKLSAPGGLLAGQTFSVTGYSLGGQLATAFNLMHPGAAQQVVTFNGAGMGKIGMDGEGNQVEFNVANMQIELPKMISAFSALRAQGAAAGLADQLKSDSGKAAYLALKEALKPINGKTPDNLFVGPYDTIDSIMKQGDHVLSLDESTDYDLLKHAMAAVLQVTNAHHIRIKNTLAANDTHWRIRA